MIDALTVKKLREKTGAGIMMCKQALTATNGDLNKSVDWLRAKGLANAAQKSSRITAEGLIGISIHNLTASIVEMNSETDFVARNAMFQELVREIAQLALANPDINLLKETKTATGKSVHDFIIENISTIGENLTLRRVNTITVSKGVIASYVHNSVSDGLGKIAVIIGIESSGDKTKLMAFGRRLAMHIAATNPQALTIEELDPLLVQHERSIHPTADSLNKFFEEVVLLEQTFIIDGKTKICELINNTAKEIGAAINITRFIRYEVGEGIEQNTTDFVHEVAAVSASC